MKNLFMLALALVMTCTFAFAASQSPYSKGKYFAEKTIEYSMEGDEEALESLDESFTNYVESLESEDDVISFFNGFKAGLYEACETYGLDEEVAEYLFDTLLEELAASL